MSGAGRSLAPALLVCLVTAAVGYSPPAPSGCFQDDVKKFVPIGTEWTGPGCNKLICTDSGVSALPCALLAIAPGCKIVDGDETADFPACCPQVECGERKPGGCYREDTEEWVDDGTTWTAEGCTLATCRDGGITGLPCGLVGLADPDSGCRLEEGDPGAPYPACCVQMNCSVCWAEEVGRSVPVGEKWTLEGCSGQATCRAPGISSAVGCPLMAVPPGSPCSLNDGDPTSDDYPRCCPRITCPDCHSETHGEHFGPGETWTEAGCLKQECELSEDGRYAGVLNTPCASMQDPPSDDYCTRSEPTAGEFPLCCPVYTCRDHCFSESNGKFYRISETWTEKASCSKATCMRGTDGNAVTALIPCAPPPPPPHDDCFTVSNTSADFPDCCTTFECPEPTCFSESKNRNFNIGESWTDEDCNKVTCLMSNGRAQKAVLPCGLIAIDAGCTVTDGDPTAEYPGCCPQQACY